jgi:murein DD-endopeptidase MepM/ murein hydrolase activator NlpD
MRSQTKEMLKTLAAVLGVAAVCAMPALAAAGPELGTRFGYGRLGAWAGEMKKHERRILSRGPFVPVVGEPDFGTAENAFGAPRPGHVHAGQDIFAPAGTPLVAVTRAIVAETGTDGGQGNYVYLYDPKRDVTYVYMHMVAPAIVHRGDRVRPGERLGGVGCTGSCWGDHLHFEVRAGRGYEGEPRDPMPLLRDWARLERPR